MIHAKNPAVSIVLTDSVVNYHRRGVVATNSASGVACRDNVVSYRWGGVVTRNSASDACQIPTYLVVLYRWRGEIAINSTFAWGETATNNA